MQCVHVDTLSGAYSVKDNEPIPELRKGDVLIKASYVWVSCTTEVDHSVRSTCSVCMHVCLLLLTSATCRCLVQG